MAKVKVDMKWTPDAFQLGNIMSELDAEVRRIAEDGVRAIAKKARSELEDRTPGQVLPKGWRDVVVEDTPVAIKVEVRNFDPRAYKIIKLVHGGGSTNLVEMLEYGTSPTHDIVPTRYRKKSPTTGGPKALFFHAYGKSWTLGRVKPRGIRPYAMVRLTYISTAVRIAKLQKAISVAITKRWKKGK